MADLNPDQFLPGMEDMRPALPHEQTERQFHNRPDVMVHARFMNVADVNAPGAHAQMGNWPKPEGFHAGTEKAAYERVQNLGPPNVASDPHPRYFHGHVDPEQMRNRPQEGVWETKGGYAVTDPGRVRDKGEDWEPKHHNKYYRNDYEDEGSTSSVHGWKDPQRIVDTLGSAQHRSIPENFTTRCQGVTQARESGAHVPSHVQALYDATGGEAGPHHVLHPDLDRHVRAEWSRRTPAEDPLLSATHPTASKRWQPNLKAIGGVDLG